MTTTLPSVTLTPGIVRPWKAEAMFRSQTLSVAAAILFCVTGSTAYAGSVKPQPLGAIAPASDTEFVRFARGGYRGGGFAVRGYRGAMVGRRGPYGGGAMAWGGRYGGRGYAVRGPHGGGRAVAVGPRGGVVAGARGPYGRGRAVAVGPRGRVAYGVRGRRGGAVAVGTRYRGGVWYGPGRRYWRGRWWAYGVGSCWRWTDIGYVWICY